MSVSCNKTWDKGRMDVCVILNIRWTARGNHIYIRQCDVIFKVMTYGNTYCCWVLDFFYFSSSGVSTCKFLTPENECSISNVVPVLNTFQGHFRFLASANITWTVNGVFQCLRGPRGHIWYALKKKNHKMQNLARAVPISLPLSTFVIT